ncbi:hypothetical protein ABZ078_43970 [Streptomyces sp. NPDC006385]|uniref:hypothetical protein n=1 Tax=Streptomyces sp. NPDC006385 TaxID=3156761 RepID=UPI0033B32D40
MISRATPPPSLRLWAGVLLACALALCLTGVARPAMAMAMSAPAESTHPMGEATDAADPAAGTRTTADSLGPEDSCPSSSDDDCAQPSAAPPHNAPAAQAAPACADGPQTPMSVLPGGPRSGVPPPAEAVAPPDLHRLCVSRT